MQCSILNMTSNFKTGFKLLVYIFWNLWFMATTRGTLEKKKA